MGHLACAYLLSAGFIAAAAAQVPDGAIFVPLIRNEALTAYYAELAVGTPPQSAFLKIDTGSPTYSLQAKSNPACERADRPCDLFGSFDNTTSSTSSYRGTGFSDQLSTHGSGDYLEDTVTIGGVTTENLYFGYLLRYGFPERAPVPAATILGLSLPCNATTCGGDGPYMLQQLYDAGTIDHMAVSIYHGRDEVNATGSMVLGGYYDKAKVGGELFTVEMTNPFNSTLSNGQTNSANVTALEVNVDGNVTTRLFGEKDVGVPVLLDNGVANWYLPSSITDLIYPALGGIIGGFNPSHQAQPISCDNLDPNIAKGSVTVEFGTSGSIEVPLSALVTKFADDNCVTFVYTRGETEINIFGDPFLRSVYSIFDQQRLTVTMARVRYTDEVELVAIPEGGFRAQ
ncbi:acid protease [Periconia macrospinosa]|uniref:Acid protease n=1 Tax=Periconia macrospinosa TaxID=97972 RepID=A0A2V1E5I9_9PLEO|nr:acid protease [Periconia macrospinosa]